MTIVRDSRFFVRGVLSLILPLLVPYTFDAMTAAPEVDVNQASELARVTVQISTGGGKQEFFSVHRREDFEDIFYAQLPLRASGFSRNPYFFEVSDQGYEFHNDRVDYHLNEHGPAVYYVAVAANSDQVYRLSGFKDSQSEFNRMASEYRIRISEADAIQYFELYLDVDPRNLRIKVPPTILELKQSAESEFHRAINDFTEAELSFDRWWKEHSNAIIRQSAGPTVTETSAGYSVDFLMMSGVDKKHLAAGPGLLKVSVQISRGGQVQGPKFTPIPLR